MFNRKSGSTIYRYWERSPSNLTQSAPAPLPQSFGIARQSVFTILGATTHKIAETTKIRIKSS